MTLLAFKELSSLELSILLSTKAAKEDAWLYDEDRRMELLAEEMRTIECLLAEATEGMQAVVEGGMDTAAKADTRRRAFHAEDDHSPPPARPSQRLKTQHGRLDANRGEPSVETTKPGQPTARDFDGENSPNASSVESPRTPKSSERVAVETVNNDDNDAHVMLLGADTRGSKRRRSDGDK